MSQQSRYLRLIGNPDITACGANPNAAVAPLRIADQVAKCLRHSCRGVPLQPNLYLRCRPAQIEGASQRRSAKPVDTTNPPRLLISQHPQLGGNCVLERPCSYGCEIGLNDEVRYRRRKQLSQFSRHWLIWQQGNSGERRHRAKCRQPQPRRLTRCPLHQFLGRQRSLPQPWPMPGSGFGQLIQLQHSAWRGAGHEPHDGHTETCCRWGVRLLAERVAAAFSRSGEEAVCCQPCLGDQPPAGCCIGAEPLVIVGCGKQCARPVWCHESSRSGTLDDEGGVSRVGLKMSSEVCHVPSGEPTATKQLESQGRDALSNELDVVQQRERGPGRGPVNEV